MLQDENYFEEVISKDINNEYYWTNDWNADLYVKLAILGFISTSHDTKEGLILLPELQLQYGILDFKNLHISKKVQKLVQSNDAKLCFNTRFDEILTQFSKQHKYNWLKNEYIELMQELFLKKNELDNFKITSIALIDKKTDALIAGEIGYVIGKTYTSLSGFSSKEKKYTNYGTLQLVLLAKHLQSKEFSFWNLGHPHMQYKKHLGSITHSRKEFLSRWKEATKTTTIEII